MRNVLTLPRFLGARGCLRHVHRNGVLRVLHRHQCDGTKTRAELSAALVQRLLCRAHTDSLKGSVLDACRDSFSHPDHRCVHIRRFLSRVTQTPGRTSQQGPRSSLTGVLLGSFSIRPWGVAPPLPQGACTNRSTQSQRKGFRRARRRNPKYKLVCFSVPLAAHRRDLDRVRAPSRSPRPRSAAAITMICLCRTRAPYIPSSPRQCGCCSANTRGSAREQVLWLHLTSGFFGGTGQGITDISAWLACCTLILG